MPTGPQLQSCTRFEWERIVRRCLIPLKLKGFAYTLAQYGDEHGREIRPGNPRLMAVCAMGERSVERYLEQLRALGLVARVKRGGGPSKRADEYRLTVPTDLFVRVDLLDPDERTPATHMAAVPCGKPSSTSVENPESPATHMAAVPCGKPSSTSVENPESPATQMAAVLTLPEPELPPFQSELPPKRGLTPATQVADHQETNQPPTKTSPQVSTSPVDPQASRSTADPPPAPPPPGWRPSRRRPDPTATPEAS